jgi:hypothetical protein
MGGHDALPDVPDDPLLREYNSMGQEFKKRQQQVLGEDGFARYIESVAQLEKTLRISDLGRYTPALS